MFIGGLRKRITLQRRNATLDAAGASIPSWQDVGTYWAAIAPLSGRELQAAQSVQSSITHEVTLRWLGGTVPDPTMQIVYGTRKFNINAVINQDERNRTLTLSCTEIIGESPDA